MTARFVVAGLGNDFRRDDGAGPAVARLVAASVGALDVGPVAEPLDLLGRWDGAELAVLIDATRSGQPAGTVSVVDLDAAGSETPASTHALGLARVVRLAEVLCSGPRRVVVVGIEGAEFSDGSGLSDAVAAALPSAAAKVVALLAEAKGSA